MKLRVALHHAPGGLPGRRPTPLDLLRSLKEPMHTSSTMQCLMDFVCTYNLSNKERKKKLCNRYIKEADAG